MHVDTDAEVSRLRELLRGLVALSAIPAVWVERAATVRESGTEAVAAGLADALVRLLQLDFAFVRLCDPAGAGAADVTRGGAWKRFSEWLESHLAAGTQFTRKELVADVSDGPQPCRGFAIPIGLHGEGGVVAAACERSDFPTATDQLLLSLAANQASTAFQSARLVHERRRAEEELREARNELEMKVTERTGELRRSEAYLAEAQRLTHTGSFAIDVSAHEPTHSSGEHSRLYGFDPEQGIPSIREFLQRIHPQDRAKYTEALERGIREATNIEVEYRVVLPQSPVRHHRAIAHPVFDASGELDEFVGTIVDVTERRRAETELERLAGEQAALRRVATLVAREASQAAIFTAIAEEVGQLLGTEEIRMLRYEDERRAVVVASSGEAQDVFPIGSRVPLGGENAASRVFRTGEPARIADYGLASGPIADTVRSIAIRSVVATPVVVEGRLWGAMLTGTTQDEPLPPETEARLGQFTELMATAIANTESHARADRLTEEQAALRRVATLVAKEAPPGEVFAKVAEEVTGVIGDVDCALCRDEGDGTITNLAAWGAGMAATVRVGERLPVDGSSVVASVLDEGRPCRIDDYSADTGAIAERGQEHGIRSAVGCPIVVHGRTWGAVVVARYVAEPLSPETEARIARFTELAATAIANAEARAEVERLAEEQAALRRVAMLVADGAAPTAVFGAITAEMERLLDADGVTLSRYEPGEEVTLLAHRGPDASRVPPGTRVRHEDESVSAMVRRTERPARMANYEGTCGAIAGLVHKLGVRSAVGAPIVVDGRPWGVIIANWRAEESPPADTEERMAQFAELLATAIANADSRDQLTASRARLLAASDEARRRFERDLHDGVQQRLVSLALELRWAEEMAPRENEELARQLAHVVAGLAGTLDDLRELSRGIHPAILSEGGLVPALKALARRSAVPVELDLAVEKRLADHVEVGAYYVASEALANAAKHARASRVEVRARAGDGVLELGIDDDGVGGADPARGSGLTGLTDRVEALGGTIAIASPPGEGTSLRVELPLDSQ